MAVPQDGELQQPCFHDEYLPTFNRTNVHLVDAHGHGVERFTETGLVANGEHFELDCIIFATGFEVGTAYTRRSGYDIVGRGGRKLSDKWSGGMATLHGLQTEGFPNAFFMGFTQGAVTVNVPQTLNEQAVHVTHLLEQVRSSGATLIEATTEGEDAWVAEMRSKERFGARFRAECTPGYYNNQGGVENPNGFFGASYGAGPVAFFDLLSEWRERGDLDGCRIS